MSAATPPKQKGNFVTYTLVFLFSVSLVLIYMLGESHKQTEAELTTRLTATGQKLALAEQRLSASEEGGAGLRAEIDTQKRQHQQQVTDWREKLTASAQTIQQGEQAVQTLKTAHAEAVDTLKVEHKQAIEVLQTNHEQAIGVLQTKHEQVIGMLQAKHEQVLEAEQKRSAQARVENEEKQRQALALTREQAQAALQGQQEKHQQAMALYREEAQAVLDGEKAAYAELQVRFEAADKENTALKSELDSLNKTMAWLKAGIAEQEKALRERVETYRIALEGGEPERAFRFAQLEVKVHEAQEALQKARYDWAVREAEYTNRLSATEQLAQGKVEALNASSRANAEYQEQLAASQQELTETREQAAKTVEEMEARHRTEIEGLNVRLAEIDQELGQVKGRLEQTVHQAEEVKAELQKKIDTLGRTSMDQRTQAEAIIADLNEKLSQSERLLSETGQELAAANSRLQDTARQAEVMQGQMQETIGSLKKVLAREREESKSAAEAMQTRHAAQVEDLETRHAAQVEDLETKHAAQVEDLETKHAAQVEDLETRHRAQVEDLETRHRAQLEDLETKHQAQLEDLETKHQAQLEDLETKHRAQVDDLETRLSVSAADLARNQEQYTLLEQTRATEQGQARTNIQSIEEELAQRNTALETAMADLNLVQESMRKLEVAKQAVLEKNEALGQTLAVERGNLEDTRRTLDETRREQLYQQQLYRGFSELGARHTVQGMQLTLAESDLQFSGGEANLPPGGLESLVHIADFLKLHMNLQVLLIGHTDSAGREETNLALSKKRAEAVKTALMNMEIEDARIVTEGAGEAQPVASNQSFTGRRKNRRVEVFITEM